VTRLTAPKKVGVIFHSPIVTAQIHRRREGNPAAKNRPLTRSQAGGGLKALRVKRDAAKWHAAIKRVEDTARGGANLMPDIIEAVEAHATVGEISDAMRRV